MIRRHFSIFLFLLYSLLGLVFLSWSADNVVRVLRYTTQYLLSPFVEPPLAAMERLGDFGSNLARLIDLDRTYRSLEREGLIENFDRLRCDAVEAENRRLISLLGVAPLPRFTPLAARVWGRETAEGLQSLTIRRGERDGVRAADPVVVLEGDRMAVLGQVAEVFPDTSRVALVTDPSSAISAAVLRTGEQGAAEGFGSSKVVLNYLFSDTQVKPGDEVVTAGLGNIFPSGLLLGTVEKLENPGTESFRRAVLKPAARFGSTTEVLVLLRVRGEKP